MNQALKDLWKKNFPLWPDVLFQKFADQIEIEANFFDPQFGINQKNFYDAAVSNVSRNFAVNWNGQRDVYANFSLINPTNPRYASSQSWDSGNLFPYSTPQADLYFGGSVVPPSLVGEASKSDLQGGFTESPFRKGVFALHVGCTWDSRLFDAFNLSWGVTYTRTGSNFMMSYLWIMSYSSIAVAPVSVTVHAEILNAAKPYAQSDSLIALHENGFDMDGIDYPKLYEFNSYVKASQNFNAQIQGAAEVARKTAAADVLNYKSDLDSKLLAQKNNLQNLTLQLTSQTAAEAASAKRDMQQLALQVATIKLQIMGLLK